MKIYPFGLQRTFAPPSDEGGGALSVDAAVAQLNADPAPAPKQAKVAAEPEEAPVTAADPAEGGSEEITADPAGDENLGGAEEPLAEGSEEGNEGTENEPSLVKPPSHWAAEDVAAFNELPAALQAKVAKYEEQASAATSKAIQTATEARKVYEQETESLKPLKARLTDVLVVAETQYKNRWEGVNWPEELAKDFQRATTAKAVMEQELAELNGIRENYKAVQTAEEENFMKANAAAFPEAVQKAKVPELLDPVKGKEHITKTGHYLIASGIEPERLKYVSGTELALAYKAMRYDELQAELIAKPPARAAAPASAPKPAGLRPSAAPSASAKDMKTRQADSRLAKTGKIDDAVALLNLMN